METMPANTGVEQALLGALIFDNRRIDEISDRITEISFYAEQHVIIWRALNKMRQQGGVADANTLLEFFARDNSLKKIGGEKYLIEMVDNMAVDPEFDDYVGILLDLENRRGLIQMAQKVEAEALNPASTGLSAADIASNAQSIISGVMLGTQVKPPVEVHAGMAAYVDKVRKAKEDNTIPCLSTGIPDLDRRLVGGLYPPDLIVLAGRPSMGKTMKAIAMADGIARGPSLKEPEKKASVLFHSLEMSADQIIPRLMTLNTHMNLGKKFNSKKMRSFEISDEALEIMDKCSHLIGDIHIDDRSNMRLRDIRIRALDHIRRVGYLDFLVIDYIGIMGHEPEDIKRGNAYAIGVITQGLKRLAKELNIPILLLAQLSRGVESRENRRPMLSDLRDSGALEQDADIVIFCYREAYYVEREEPQRGCKDYQDKFDNWEYRLRQCAHDIETIAAKQRLGPIGTDKHWCELTTGYIGHADPISTYGSARDADPRWGRDKSLDLE